jgi:hypothetical protein
VWWHIESGGKGTWETKARLLEPRNSRPVRATQKTPFQKNGTMARSHHHRLMPIILAMQEAEIRRITVRSPKQIVHETLSQKYPTHT